MAGKPNLLIIHTDQQSWWTLGCYGGTVVETPNIDRLAANGARFTNFFTNSAVCTPSRGCFVTGRYPESHGAYVNNVPLNRDEITFAEVLRQEGYRTGYVGKWHLDGTPRPGWVHPDRTMGFDEAEYMFNRGHWKKMEDTAQGDVQPTVYPYRVIGDEETYATDWLTNKALKFLEANDDQAFCFMLSLPDPHGPVDVRPPYDTLFEPSQMELPASFVDENLPDWAANLQRNSPFGTDKPNRADTLRRFLALYYGEVKLIDDAVGRILAKLEADGIMDNTIIVFTTDHGEYAGEHGLQGKNHIYETAYRIPMIIHWPAGIAPGTVVDQLVSTVDFQPTILTLMGVDLCGREQGRDGSALMQQNDAAWNDEVQFHHANHRFAGVFTRRYELALVRDGKDVLFDRINDPQQMHNLIEDPAHADTVSKLRRKIIDHHQELDTPSARWLAELG